MHFSRLLAALLAAQAALPAAVSLEAYHTRRAALAKSIQNGVLVLFGHTEKNEETLRTGFIQESNFYYLTGCQEPGAILLLEPQPEDRPREILFLPRHDPNVEKWTGRKTAPGDPDASEITGFQAVLPVESFETELRRELDTIPSFTRSASSPRNGSRPWRHCATSAMPRAMSPACAWSSRRKSWP